MKLQDMKTKKWKAKGTITEVRTASDGTIVSYGLVTSDGSLTTMHRKYIQKIPGVSNEETENRAEADRALKSSRIQTQ